MNVVSSLRAVVAGCILLGAAAAQQKLAGPASNDADFICPMDKDVREKQPGTCPRCGMKLIPGIPDSSEYPVYLDLSPRVPRPDKPVGMTFRVEDPKTHATVRKYEIVHEKLFHLFLVSDDLSYFAHEHPTPRPDGTFVFDAKLPQAGPYRVVADFYPAGGTPQMNISTMYVAGQAVPKKPPAADLRAQTGGNLKVSISTEPPQPLAGFKTLMFFQLEPADGGAFELEPYIGAWGHMLAVSEDLVDFIHTHPFIADGGPKVQFNMIFPREGIYRVWVQFQSKGQVNTVAFNVPVKELR
ncbi:MAG: hypothetical protein LC126_13895 [Bryobacterales bacterium]|nr:hypothetical protein [Bryobacterales bacterium]